MQQILTPFKDNLNSYKCLPILSLDFVHQDLLVMSDNEQLEYDTSDLSNTTQQSSIVIPPRQQQESLTDFMQNVYNKDMEISKQDMRQQWVKVSRERENAVRQYRTAKDKLKYWMIKAKRAEQLVKECEAKLQKLDTLVIADITLR